MAKKRLGRGLDYLISAGVEEAEEEPGSEEEVKLLPLGRIRPNPYQPRQEMDEEADRELADSIRRNGVLQPVVVRRSADGYELVAGERRWRACQSIETMESVPALVRSISDRKMLELALIENVQRRNLNPVELARAYKDMAERLSITHEEVADRVGKSRASVTNHIRLLGLPQEILDHVSRGTLSMGHARSLLAIKTETERKALVASILSTGLSVRDTEKAVRKGRKSGPRTRTPYLVELEEQLMTALGTKVRIQPSRKGGKIVIDYYSNEDFDRILGCLEAGGREPAGPSTP